MIVKQILDEDFVNYKKPSMFIGFPSCTFKCEIECGEHCCQNSALAQSPNIEVSVDNIVQRYLSNPITSAIVCGGLERMDSFEDLWRFIFHLRVKGCTDDVVIYTGYYENEIPQEHLNRLSLVPNIIIKFGRFKPNEEKHYDNILGVLLASNNQYARRIS